MKERIEKYGFLFEELIKRDFKKKYKRTTLGVIWSLLYPLMTLLIMTVMFTQFFGRTTPNYTIYVFCGNILFSYFREATSGGMNSFVENAGIFSKVNVPKYLFLLSKNVSSMINFGIILIVLFAFVIFDGLPITLNFLLLIYPIVCLTLFNIGVGLILSALYVFFTDMQYIYDIFTMLLMYMSAIFYTTSAYPENLAKLFNLNPIFVYIDYFRTIIIHNSVPSLDTHLLCIGYAVLAVAIGYIIYKKNNQKFMYYV